MSVEMRQTVIVLKQICRMGWSILRTHIRNLQSEENFHSKAGGMVINKKSN